MRKAAFALRFVVAVFVCGFAFCATSCTSSSSITSAGTSSAHTTLHARITIATSQGLFEPFILAVQPGTIVTWQNNDAGAHVITTTPDQSAFLNSQSFSLKLAAHTSATFTFTQAGLYHYYENKMATWNTEYSRVAANQGVPHFPLAMDGVIWVQGSINNLPTASLNSIPTGQNDFAIEFLAIKQFGAVTWHNFDAYSHFLGIVPGWSAPINPVDIGLYRIPGTRDVPNGDTATVFFNTPGLYYYYCRNHVTIDPTTHRAQTLMMDELPIPMEGFILVIGS